MARFNEVSWRLALLLGAFALVRPLLSMAGVMDALGEPAAPLVATAVISAVWIAVVGLSRVRHPVRTLVAAGLIYAVLAVVLSAVGSVLLTGQLQGPLATPWGAGVLATLAVNAIWGAAAGVLAAALQRALNRHHQPHP
ncbi:hypothetical protein [Saccharopolyspora griseoalba]|uniref:Integral membrane protein n=1 Tax=Saccharopolyspora griseoalba TaxID=1431848 RepID=A0ABW2LJ56_9PSEU